LNKISIYDVSEENYKNAWKLLNDSYERKRILIAKHLNAIIELPAQGKVEHKSLTKLVDEVKQHVNALASLGVHPDSHWLVRVIERALPPDTRSKWEETLSLDATPTLEQLYGFVTETAFRVSTLKQEASRFGGGSKRPHTRAQPSKARRDESGARVLITNTNFTCPLCKKEKHCLYRCSEFAKLSVPRRWDFVKKTKLCRNCLRAHGGECKWSHCKFCSKPHNSLLHNATLKPKVETATVSNSTTVPAAETD